MNNDIEVNDSDFGFKQEPSWTSVDLYYKGVHIKKSVPDNIKIDLLKKTIDEYLEAGFQPSWNQETNKAVQTTIPTVTADLGVCPNCKAPMKMSSKGKPYCSALCWKK